jgi:hydrogenase-1 operon protein HyaF
MNTQKPFPIPIMPIGPGTQPEDEDVLDYMVMPQGMETWRPPVLPEREEIAQLLGAQAVLGATLAALERARQGLPTQPVDLAALSDADRKLINQVMGEGEVSVRVHLPEGELLVQESVFAGVWRVMRQIDGVVMSDHIEVGRIPMGVMEMAGHMVPPGSQRRVKLTAGEDESWPHGVMNAPPILNELEDHIQGWKPGVSAHVVNLTLLPLSPEDIALIDQTLGVGPIQILSRGYGNCRILHTEVPLTWRVSYFNSQDALILDTVEVTDLPEVACAAREDLEDSLERLADMLHWVQGD